MRPAPRLLLRELACNLSRLFLKYSTNEQFPHTTPSSRPSSVGDSRGTLSGRSMMPQGRISCARIAGVCLTLCVAGCGDSSSGGSVTAPGPAATSISVTVREVVLVGTTAVATATATLSNGQQQPVTSGRRSDATTVATVTGAGIVTGIANGEASIAVAFDGHEGAKRIRVAPNYDGQWHGLQVVTACTASGGFSGACEEGGGVAGERFPVALSARQPADLSVAGEFIIEGIAFPTFSAQVEGDGTIRFRIQGLGGR